MISNRTALRSLRGLQIEIHGHHYLMYKHDGSKCLALDVGYPAQGVKASVIIYQICHHMWSSSTILTIKLNDLIDLPLVQTLHIFVTC